MEREARRKKIQSRETDRMALITGRIQAADPNVAKSSSFSHNSQDNLAQLAKHTRSSSQPVRDDDVTSFPDRPHGGDELPDRLLGHDNDEHASQSRGISALVITRASSTSQDANHPRKPFEYHLNSISLRDINLSIISSENTRCVCSFVIAILVVLSQVKVIKSKSLLAYRPLYAILLSDLLIVSATVALFSQRKENEKEAKLKGDINWDGAVMLLEWGLILHQAIRGIFIDCSVYLAIVICSLTLMQ